MLAGYHHPNWIPSLYFTEGLPYIAITLVSLIFYKQMGLSNSEITFYTSWLYLPWVLRPLWSPFQRLVNSHRWWASLTQLLVGASLGGVAFMIPSPLWFQGTLFFFWATAFAAATHENTADVLYEQTIDHHDLNLFLGGRTAFHHLASIFEQGILVMLAGNLQLIYRNSISYSWSLTVYGLAGLILALWLCNRYLMPSTPLPSRRHVSAQQILHATLAAIRSFLRGQSGRLLFAFLLYRMADGLLSKVGMLFLIDASHNGGLGLSPQEYGFVQGTLGVFALALGGVVSGFTFKHAEHRWSIHAIVTAMLLPPAIYLVLSYALPNSFIAVSLAVALSQFCVGFGTLSFLFHLIGRYESYLAPINGSSSYLPSPYMLTRATLVLALLLPGLFSGLLQEIIGYRPFFALVLLVSGALLRAALYISVDSKI